VLDKLGPVQFIAEDLGLVTPEVKALRDRFNFPGMRVLQFAFGDEPEANNYLPHTFPRNCVVYTGTHDNDTTVGWFHDNGSHGGTRNRDEIRREREFAMRYAGTDGREIHWDFIRMAFSSVANTAIIPAQDILGLGSEARMNTPGTSGNNWEWRLRKGELDGRVADRLLMMTETYGRKSKVKGG
jgi:4-alpha-glucanotransferase